MKAPRATNDLNDASVDLSALNLVIQPSKKLTFITFR